MSRANRINLTLRKLQSLKGSPTRQIDYWDNSFRRFGVRVAPSGRKTFTVLYRYNQKVRRLTLGTFPIMSLAEARELAEDALRQLKTGHDPSSGTFGELVADYWERHAKRKKKETSLRNDRWMINRHLLPRWEHVKLRDISRPRVRSLIESITDDGAPILANRVHALLSKIFNFAISRDLRTDNPCIGVEKNIEKSRDRVLSDDEIKAIWSALANEDPFIKALFGLRFLTAARGGEVRHMRWADLDLDAGWWNLPPEFVKNDRAHRLPLVTEASTLLSDLRTWQSQRLQRYQQWACQEEVSAEEGERVGLSVTPRRR